MSSITAVPGIRVGHAHDTQARTGCTVLLGSFRGAVDVRGLASGSRELDALSPLHVTPSLDAVLLTGGSAFGLRAAEGVVDWLEERGIGYDTFAARVPIVPGAVIYDLGVGSARIRPDAAMGRAACDAASDAPVAEGAVGVGAGATVGKLRGPQFAQPSGVGSWAERVAGYTVGALVVVNAVGDVLDGSARILAGTLNDDGSHADSAALLRSGLSAEAFRVARTQPGTNTTLAVVATDAPLSKSALQVVARAATTGMVRRISPVNTPFDGDITFALSTAREIRDVSGPELLVLGVTASYALEIAIERAVLSARSTT